jgi:hypothetical protein
MVVGVSEMACEWTQLIPSCTPPTLRTALHLQMNAEDEGVLHFFDDQWQASPSTTDGSFLSPDDIVDKQVVVTFKIYTKRMHRGEAVYDKEIGTGKSITMHYCPGRPYSILQVGYC